jgi:hypothetical protein
MNDNSRSKRTSWKKKYTELYEEFRLLAEVARDLQFYARRYCDGRASYAPSDLNGMTRYLLTEVKTSIHIDAAACPPTIWAKDAMGSGFSGISQDEWYKDYSEGGKEIYVTKL